MRFWILLFIALTVVMLVMLPLTANTVQAQMHTKVTALAGDNVPQAARGVAAQVIVSRPHIAWNNYLNRYAIVRPRVAVKPKEIWAVRQHGIWPFNRTWIYHRLE